MNQYSTTLVEYQDHNQSLLMQSTIIFEL